MGDVIPLFGYRGRTGEPGPEFVPETVGYRQDPSNADRSRRGADLCRSVLTVPGESQPLDPDSPIRDRALRRARAERRRTPA